VETSADGGVVSTGNGLSKLRVGAFMWFVAKERLGR
jgi:hypothetical protein